MTRTSHASRLLSRVVLCGALCAPGAHALDPSATPELARLAECNRIAGKTTGVKRDTLIAGCMERIDGDVPTQQTLDAIPVTPVAPAPAARAAPDGLPPQEIILACARRVQDLAGEARSLALKACLAGKSEPPVAATQAPATAPADTEQRRRAVCNVLAHDRQGEARKSYITACVAGSR